MSTIQRKNIERILAKADVALRANQYLKGKEVFSGSVTVVGSGSGPNTSSGYFTRFYDSSVITDDKTPWQVYGGTRNRTSWGENAISTTSDRGTSPVTVSPQESYYEFLFDGNEFVIVLEANKKKYQILVEDTDGIMKPVDVGGDLDDGLTPVLVTGTAGTKAYYTVTFNDGVQVRRRVGLQVAPESAGGTDGGLFGGIYVRDEEQVWAPARDRRQVVIVGDSMGQARNGAHSGGPTSSMQGLWTQAFRILGFKNIRVAAVGGTGVLEAGSWPSGNYGARANDVLDLEEAPALVLFQESFNDYGLMKGLSGTDPEDAEDNIAWWSANITPAVANLITNVRAQFPDTLIGVVGIIESNDETHAPPFQTLNALEKAGVDVLGDPATFYFDFDAKIEGPITGVYPSSGGNAYLIEDSVTGHLTPGGQPHVAFAVAEVLLEKLEDTLLTISDDYIPPPVTYGDWTYVCDEGDTFVVTESSGVAYRFGETVNWSDNTFFSVGSHVANYTSWPNDPSPGHAKTVEIGTPV